MRNYKDNNYNSFILTFQIGLHIDDLEVLKFIQRNLGCGKISISKNKCNFFVNDQASLIYIIMPIFNVVKLKSSKYDQFLVFEKAINLIKNKEHLKLRGRNEIIKYYQEIKNPSPNVERAIVINKYWLAGFVDGDATFSVRGSRPRLKFENHYKELPLFNAIIEYFQYGKINISNTRKNRINSNQTVTLEFNNIHFLKNVILPLFLEGLLNTKKEKDFIKFSILVDIYYYGYHTIAEGESLAREITSYLNKLSTHSPNLTSYQDFNEKYKLLSKIPSPYTIKEGVRFYRNTLKLVSDKIKILAIDHLNKEFVFSSISECSRILQIERVIIKNCLLSGEIACGYSFKFHLYINFDRKEG